MCPVTAVPAISSSVMSEASKGIITGSTLTAPITTSTAAAQVGVSTAIETSNVVGNTKSQSDSAAASTAVAGEQDTTTTETSMSNPD